jgi:hypothetical protein
MKFIYLNHLDLKLINLSPIYYIKKLYIPILSLIITIQYVVWTLYFHLIIVLRSPT